MKQWKTHRTARGGGRLRRLFHVCGGNNTSSLHSRRGFSGITLTHDSITAFALP